MSTTPLCPDLVVHCDWGTHPNKRWMAKAVRTCDGYVAHAPELVGDLDTLICRIATERGTNGSALVGFDFPIGIPTEYALNALAMQDAEDKTSNFLMLLPQLGAGIWKDFYSICNNKDEISIHRPFYPYNFTPQGTKKRDHLVEGLKVKAFESLLRRCERPQKQLRIPAAGALFWTLGAKAPGRGAIEGWKNVIMPALQTKQIRLWPFEGALSSMLVAGATVVAETYPTQYHQRLFDQQLNGKGNQDIRKRECKKLPPWTRSNLVELSPLLAKTINAGFPQGDDAFDATIGLFGMIDAVQNYTPALEPQDLTIRNIEGWILGQPIP